MKFPKSISGSYRSDELQSFIKNWDLEHNWCYPKYTKPQHSLLASRVCSSSTSHLCIAWFWALVLWCWSLASCHSTLHCCCHSVLLPMTLPLPLQPLHCSSLSICCICAPHSTATADLLTATSVIERNNWISCPIFEKQLWWVASSSLKLHRLQICAGI